MGVEKAGERFELVDIDPVPQELGISDALPFTIEKVSAHVGRVVAEVEESTLHLGDLGHVGVLALFAIVMWRLAIWRLGKRLID